MQMTFYCRLNNLNCYGIYWQSTFLKLLALLSIPRSPQWMEFSGSLKDFGDSCIRAKKRYVFNRIRVTVTVRVSSGFGLWLGLVNKRVVNYEQMRCKHLTALLFSVNVLLKQRFRFCWKTSSCLTLLLSTYATSIC